MTTKENIARRIFSVSELKMQVNRWKFQDKKIVFTNGCFDLLHPGHIHCLSESADFGDILIVGLNSDRSVKALKGDGRPVHGEKLRAEILASLFFVDAVVIFDEDTPETIIRDIRPDVLVKGGDYTINTIAGANYVLESGGKVEIIPLKSGHSTTGLLNGH